MLHATDHDFPLLDRDLLLPQAEITVNLLRPCTTDTTVSAWEHIRGPYDFHKHPLGPAGCKVVVYEGPATRASWGAHGHVGFYTGPALSHYRGFRVFLPETNRERVSETIVWFPRDVVMPGSSLTEHLDANISDLLHTNHALAEAPSLQHQHQPLGSLGPRLAENLRALQELFTAPSLPPTAPPPTQYPAVPLPYMVGVDPAAPHHSPIRIPAQPVPHTPSQQRLGETSAEQRVGEIAADQRVGASPGQQRVGETPVQPNIPFPSSPLAPTRMDFSTPTRTMPPKARFSEPPLSTANRFAALAEPPAPTPPPTLPSTFSPTLQPAAPPPLLGRGQRLRVPNPK
jgi:hypothetical protein